MIRETLRKLLFGLFAVLPAIASAHPGHYHPPGEDDEFDQVRADWLHLHGWLEISLAVTLVTSVLLFHFSKNRKVRIGAVIVFGSSLALLASS
ncbi:MAG: hypothetical protein EOP83_12000 [Verrucomicrobiaceae bacterium]|nr:MAG: hypothetical protein EOP83_12000 [Verrucomicrobiaceae bacterium]